MQAALQDWKRADGLGQQQQGGIRRRQQQVQEGGTRQRRQQDLDPALWLRLVVSWSLLQR